MPSVKMQSKSDIRNVILVRRQEIAHEEKKRFEAQIAGHIRNLPQYQEAQLLAIYYPIRQEVSLLSLMHDAKKTILFPKVEQNDLIFYPAETLEDFVSGGFGIPEPVRGEAAQVHDIDLILVPGISFDWRGHRVGYGKGYYDRLIRANPGVYTVGVCFDEFYVGRLPDDPWDACVDGVVTQTGFIRSKCEVR